MCVDYKQADGLFELYLCDEHRYPFFVGPDKNGKDHCFYHHLVCTQDGPDGQCGYKTRVCNKDGHPLLPNEDKSFTEWYLCCSHCGFNYGRINLQAKDSFHPTYYVVWDIMHESGFEPLTDEQKERIKSVVDKQWKMLEEERAEKKKEEWEKRKKTRLTENETIRDDRLLHPVRRPKPEAEPCDSCKEKAEPSNRPSYGELRIAYGKIAEARSLILQAMSHIDPLDERVDARVLPDLNMAYARLDGFLDRKLRDPILNELLGEPPKSERGEE